MFYFFIAFIHDNYIFQLYIQLKNWLYAVAYPVGGGQRVITPSKMFLKLKKKLILQKIYVV